MKKIIFNLLAVVVVTGGITSCNNQKKQNSASEQIEQDAINAGKISKKELTIELKDEISRFLKDMAESNLSLSIDKESISIVDADFMLPLNEVTKLNTNSQKARACGMYFADLQILKLMNRPATPIENNLTILCQELDIKFAADIVKEKAPADANKEELGKFIREQEAKLMKAMIDNGKVDVEMELLGGMAVEYACLLASPALIIKTDTFSLRLNEQIISDLVVLQHITTDLAKYYPDLKQLSTIISPLKDMIGTVEIARKSQKEINDIRADLLK